MAAFRAVKGPEMLSYLPSFVETQPADSLDPYSDDRLEASGILSPLPCHPLEDDQLRGTEAEELGAEEASHPADSTSAQPSCHLGGGVFDAASFGVFLGGPRRDTAVKEWQEPGETLHSHYLSHGLHSGESRVFFAFGSDGLWRPWDWESSHGSGFPLHNLHIHSKDVELFLSTGAKTMFEKVSMKGLGMESERARGSGRSCGSLRSEESGGCWGYRSPGNSEAQDLRAPRSDRVSGSGVLGESGRSEGSGGSWEQSGILWSVLGVEAFGAEVDMLSGSNTSGERGNHGDGEAGGFSDQPMVLSADSCSAVSVVALRLKQKNCMLLRICDLHGNGKVQNLHAREQTSGVWFSDPVVWVSEDCQTIIAFWSLCRIGRLAGSEGQEEATANGPDCTLSGSQFEFVGGIWRSHRFLRLGSGQVVGQPVATRRKGGEALAVPVVDWGTVHWTNEFKTPGGEVRKLYSAMFLNLSSFEVEVREPIAIPGDSRTDGALLFFPPPSPLCSRRSITRARHHVRSENSCSKDSECQNHASREEGPGVAQSEVSYLIPTVYGSSLSSTVDGGHSWSPPVPYLSYGRHKLRVNTGPTDASETTFMFSWQCRPQCVESYGLRFFPHTIEGQLLMLNTSLGDDFLSLSLWKANSIRELSCEEHTAGVRPPLSQLALHCGSEEPEIIDSLVLSPPRNASDWDEEEENSGTHEHHQWGCVSNTDGSLDLLSTRRLNTVLAAVHLVAQESSRGASVLIVATWHQQSRNLDLENEEGMPDEDHVQKDAESKAVTITSTRIYLAL
eukprot:CAMPEP_0184322498 /NCGR_PEP_ID=MMETSP1049-20130417/124771_1 /TAXON_ID=77928 /ORGANISM="Proteomonas sulcata, Strain CCMP704" /LENGTH=786 /DNA_ID=CAMNT_0026643655 /DNA_START=96 /DNA_END=2456 /DNA_ORIENTATION=-